LRSRRHICITACAGWLTVHARRHQREVCPLLRGVMLQPLSAPLQNGIRFLPPPLPAAPSAHLAVRFPSSPLAYGAGRTTGLPRSADVPQWQRPHLYAGGSPSAPQEFGACGPGHVPLWSKRVSSLRLFVGDDAYDASPGLTMPTPSWFPTALLLAVAVVARAWAALCEEEATLSRGLLSR
jgi:hypothetical protein